MAQDQKQHGNHQHHQHGRLVDVDAIHRRRIQAQEFEEEADGWVEHQIEQEEVARKELAAPLAVDQNQQTRRNQIQKALIQEKRVVLRDLFKTRHAVRRIDCDRPWELGRTAVHLLVNEVTPPADRLTDQKTGGNVVCPFEEVEFFRSTVDNEGKRAADHTAGNAQPAVPNFEDLDRITEIVLGSDAHRLVGG